eukprot:CAMPEP_0175127644 /NCGR_PEP_ID=MMETSP0087-20121206/4495_1 /TAXON_ID=136419 /ORGANISM="Unknown Unknown, Strain D1" /LENGTH=1019 /DNA_ID=CAMNT_0016409633 /DNA_START=13 /DNA_END=3072 /DNA_ORIENTATION=-
MSDQKVDEALYSRQLYVMGHEAQRKMQNSNVLLVGLRGLGVEIAKNIVLAGVKSVTLLDDNLVTEEDLSAQFFLSKFAVGQSRADACLQKLVELNKYVKVSVAKGNMDENLLSKFQVVVLTDCLVEQQAKVNDFCHSKGIKFISGDIRGLVAGVFTDFGEAHTIADDNGERPLRGLVSNITNGNPGIVTCHEDNRHGLEDGNFVTFEEVEGMVELNSIEPMKVKTINVHSFSIGDTSKMGAYAGTKGYFNQVKVPITKSYKPMSSLLTNPNILNDFMGEYRVHHAFFLGLSQFQKENNGRLPKPDSKEDAEAVLQLAQAVAATFEVETSVETDDTWLHLARCASAQLAPMAAFLGGVMGQEVLKAITGKFTPIDQFFYFDARTVLPPPSSIPDWSHYNNPNNRYSSQIAVLGKELHQKMTALSYFLVGAGAIGCEMIKNFAMMGIATSGNGCVHMTDMDTIEKSNLSRQFLFRESDVGKLKSACAASAAVSMNSDMKIEAKALRVGKDTENVYDDTFWMGLDGVCTALDNVDARLYTDTRCVYFQKPMVDSGTLGTKGNTQVVVPFLTESYGSSRDPPEEGIPICTLKHFPNKIEHTIQWARDSMEGLFAQGPAEVNNYLTEPNYVEELKKDPNVELSNLKTIGEYLVTERPLRFEQCVEWARLLFETQFNNDIVQLLTTFPPDSVTEGGTPFWSGPKRAPAPLSFNAADPVHLDFVTAAANLRAFNYGLKGSSDPDKIRQVLSQVVIPAFKPNRHKKIAATDEEAKEMKTSGGIDDDDYDGKVAEAMKILPSPATLAGYRLAAVEFEKDDDTNFHMDFITACSNLRARNYAIAEASKHETKFIAGKIIPAIATTTALVTGLVCLELYKLLQRDVKKVEDYRNGYANLALPVFNAFEPVAPVYTTSEMKDGEWKWSLWDKIDIDMGSDVTMQELIDHFEDKYGLEINMLSHGASLLYCNFNLGKKTKERLAMPISQVVTSVGKKTILPSERYLILEACCNKFDDEDAEVEIPYIRFKFR